MIAPEVARAFPPLIADERAMLEGWLDFHRATLLTKCAGLDDEQLRRRAAEPSTLSLLGLVRHMTDVERHWFRRLIADETDAPPIYFSDENEDGDFDDVDRADPEADLARYHEELEWCRAVAAGVSLDDTFVNRKGETCSVRWVFVHMIEEYARHNGHADLIRQRIDGTVGI
jgi:uncharacterized damage-inducible protein DinB